MWITVTERCDNIEKPETKINMDNIVKITPMRNLGCLLTTKTGQDLMVKELLPHFDILNNDDNYHTKPITSITQEEKIIPTIIKQEAKVELDDSALLARISEVIKNSLRGPNSEINRRLRTTVKEVLAEMNIENSQNTSDIEVKPVKIVANSTRNIMG